MRPPTVFFVISISGSLFLESCAFLKSTPEIPVRTVRVKALADPALIRSDTLWKQAVGDLVRAASDHFEREFRIRFLVGEVTAWPLEEKTPSTSLLLRRLKAEVPLEDQGSPYDLIIGFTGLNVSPYVGGRARVDRIGNCREGLGTIS